MAYSALPPADKPWLVSSQRSIDESKEQRKNIIEKWLKECPYPGNESSKEDKTNWYKRLRDKQFEEYQLRLDALILEEPPQAYEVVREVLSKGAPESLELQIKISRSDLEKIIIDCEEDAAKFSKNLALYGLNRYSGEISWEAYKRWLLNEHASNVDIITLGSIQCRPQEILMEKCMEFAGRLGIERYIGGMQSVEESTCRQISWGYYELFHKIQENMYYALENTTSQPGTTIGFSVVMKTKSCATEIEKAEYQFLSTLNVLKRKYIYTEDPKTFILISKECCETESNDDSDSEESSPPYLSEHYEVLWVPHEYVKYYDRISGHISWGEGENSAIQCRLGKGTTDTGNLRIEIIRRELNAIQIRSNMSGNKAKWREAFCATLALTKAAMFDTSWMYDNEHPDRVVELIQDLATYWRTCLLKKNNKTLGIGIKENENDSDKEPSESRKALYLYLRWFEVNFVSAGCSANIKFNWKPRSRVLNIFSERNKRQRNF